jgi:hypothetical protein
VERITSDLDNPVSFRYKCFLKDASADGLFAALTIKVAPYSVQWNVWDCLTNFLYWCWCSGSGDDYNFRSLGFAAVKALLKELEFLCKSDTSGRGAR